MSSPPLLAGTRGELFGFRGVQGFPKINSNREPAFGSDLNRPALVAPGGDLSKPPGPSLSCKSGSPVLDTRRSCGTNLSVGAVMDVVVWLRSLGLGKYEAIFSENDIDEAVLPSLTHE